jgi:hypothetical protein
MVSNRDFKAINLNLKRCISAITFVQIFSYASIQALYSTTFNQRVKKADV